MCSLWQRFGSDLNQLSGWRGAFCDEISLINSIFIQIKTSVTQHSTVNASFSLLEMESTAANFLRQIRNSEKKATHVREVQKLQPPSTCPFLIESVR